MSLNPGNDRTYTFSEEQAFFVAEGLRQILAEKVENAAATDLHTQREVDDFEREAQLIREALAIMDEVAPITPEVNS